MSEWRTEFSFFYGMEDLTNLVLGHRKPFVYVAESSAKTYVRARSGPPDSGGVPKIPSGK